MCIHVCKGLCEWFWVCSEAACGLFVFLGPYLIQRCWNHFISPSSPRAWGNCLSVTVLPPPLRHDCRLTISSWLLTPRKTTTTTDPPVRYKEGVKGSCQSCNLRAGPPWWGHSTWCEKQVNWSNQEIKYPPDISLLKHSVGKTCWGDIHNVAQCTAIT